MKIAVGLSGGVDSSVAALLLKREGHDVVALFMQNWHDTTGTLHGDCEWEEDYSVAKMVAAKLDIPLHFVDLSDIYRQKVVNYMFDEYSKGRTPNPDVMCNREVKFDAFMDRALEFGVDYVATGHYCRKDSFVNNHGETIYRVLEGVDRNKDQSYFLCQLNQKQLSKALFPIGELTKPEVRRLATEAGLPSADKKDSQGICFVGKVDLPVFLQQQLTPKEGDVVEIFESYYSSEPIERGNDLSEEELVALSSPLRYFKNDGKIIGKHNGAHFYTIGQRRGLNIGGHKEPLFVISTDVENNTIFVGEGGEHPGLYRKGLAINREEVHWIREDISMEVNEKRRYRVRIRYRQPLQDALLWQKEDALFIIFDDEQRGVTPGQFAVWYSEDGEMLGSGPIDE